MKMQAQGNMNPPLIEGPYDVFLKALDDTEYDLCAVAKFDTDEDADEQADLVFKAAEAHAKKQGYSVKELKREIDGGSVTLTVLKREKRTRKPKEVASAN